MRTKPVLYFSFRSPYSWLAIERLRKVRPDLHHSLDLIPVWNPDEHFTTALKAHSAGFHYSEMSSAKHRYVLTDIRRLAHQDGLTITWPIDRSPHWELPHLAWLASRAHGADERLYQSIVEARWTHGLDICDLTILRRLAAEAGLDPELPAKALHEPEIQTQALQCLTRAWAEDIFGFPYFRIGPHRFWGIDRLTDFLHAWGHQDFPTPTTDPSQLDHLPTYGEDTSGGCG